jgi:acyl carrier protein
MKSSILLFAAALLTNASAFTFVPPSQASTLFNGRGVKHSPFVSKTTPLSTTSLFAGGDITDRIKKVIVDQLNCKAEDVNPESRFAEDLGADSLDTVELVMALETEFDAEIPEAEAVELKTLWAATKYLDTLRGERENNSNRIKD